MSDPTSDKPGGGQAGRRQEIRQSPPLQHGDQQLRDARRPRPHDQAGRRFRRQGRQDRRGSDPLGADPDHRRAGAEGTEPAADQLSAPADRLLRRQHAVPRAGLSGAGDESLRPQPGADAQQSARHVRHVPVRPVRGNRQTEHGDVRARAAHAVARRPWTTADPAEAAPPKRGEPSRRKPRSEDPRLRRLEAQIEALRLQLEALGRGRDEG